MLNSVKYSKYINYVKYYAYYISIEGIYIDIGIMLLC